MIDNHSLTAQFGIIYTHFLSLPIEIIDKIEIIRGPGSALYGNSAFFGVINIITKRGGVKPSRLTVKAGSFNTVNPITEFSYQKDDLKAYIYSDYYYSNGYDGTIDSDAFGISPFSSAPGKITAQLQYYSFLVNISYFNIQANDIIQSQGITIVNIGTLKSTGIEAEMKLRYSQEKYAYCNFTYQDVKNTTRSTIISEVGQQYTQKDYFPGSVANILGNIGINYDITSYLIGNVYLNYVGEKKRSEEKLWNSESLEFFDSRPSIDPCLLMNASITIQNIINNIELQVTAYNLFNSDHRDPDPDGKIKNDLPRELRNFQLRLSYSF